jgi:agmatinase
LSQFALAFSGVPYDLAVTNRPGARFGPAAVRKASAQLSWGPQWPWGFDPFDRIAAADYGDCWFDHGRPEEIPRLIEQHAIEIINQGVELVSLGGDHFITLPILRAHAKRHGKLSLIHFDAHSDTWQDEGTRIDHGTMFFHAVNEGLIDPMRSVQIGIRTHNSDRLGFTWLDAAWVHDHGPDAVVEEVRRIVGIQKAYLTFDIDCLDPAYAPGTGTPVSGGLSTAQAQRVIRGLGGTNIVGMDLVEVAPSYDHAEITALAAAHLVHDYVCMKAQSLAGAQNSNE